MDSSLIYHNEKDKLFYPSPIIQSKPIQIPTRRSSFEFDDCTPITRPNSPDLIFEMSPHCSEYPFGNEHRLNHHGHYSTDESTPLLYNFPIISKQPSFGCKSIQTRKQLSPLPFTFLPHRPVSAIPKAWPRRRCPGSSRKDENVVIGSPTLKISGFTPISPTAQLESCIRPISPPSTRLSTPPSWSALTSSPWVLPGASDEVEENPDSPEASPNALHFDQFLLRRLEQKTGQRLRHSLPSMRVSCF